MARRLLAWEIDPDFPHLLDCSPEWDLLSPRQRFLRERLWDSTYTAQPLTRPRNRYRSPVPTMVK